jgi:hypothetical protein
MAYKTLQCKSWMSKVCSVPEEVNASHYTRCPTWAKTLRKEIVGLSDTATKSNQLGGNDTNSNLTNLFGKPKKRVN